MALPLLCYLLGFLQIMNGITLLLTLWVSSEKGFLYGIIHARSTARSISASLVAKPSQLVGFGLLTHGRKPASSLRSHPECSCCCCPATFHTCGTLLLLYLLCWDISQGSNCCPWWILLLHLVQISNNNRTQNPKSIGLAKKVHLGVMAKPKQTLANLI